MTAPRDSPRRARASGFLSAHRGDCGCCDRGEQSMAVVAKALVDPLLDPLVEASSWRRSAKPATRGRRHVLKCVLRRVPINC
ncbi:hypothetical protein DIPPA_25749 [Diplonema papillatum]|nr:hypothetical protein DIPPA_25749 [Diplonema papillatum]